VREIQFPPPDTATIEAIEQWRAGLRDKMLSAFGVPAIKMDHVEGSYFHAMEYERRLGWNYYWK